MRLDVGAVDRRCLGYRAGKGQFLNQVNPEASARPSVEAVVDRCRGAVLLRAITPPAPNLENMDDAGYDPAIINPRRTTSVSGQQRLDDSPLLIR